MPTPAEQIDVYWHIPNVDEAKRLFAQAAAIKQQFALTEQAVRTATRP